MSKLWHLSDLHSEWGEEDGWYVHAETAEDARRLVIEERETQFQADSIRPPIVKGMTEDERRRWYFGGDPVAQVGEPVEQTESVLRVPFLGYTW